MNETQPLRQWAIGAALALTVTQGSPLIALAAADVEHGVQESANVALNAHHDTAVESALALRLSATQGTSLPVASFYQRLHGQPAWQSEARIALLDQALETLRDDGLDPAAYRAGTWRERFTASQSAGPSAQAAFDVEASEALLLALEHLNRGKLDPRQVEAGWDAPRPERRYSMVQVAHAVERGDIDAALDAARPSGVEYQALREALARYRQLDASHVAYLPAGEASLRQGDEGSAIAILRRRLALWGEHESVAADSSAYPLIDARAEVSTRFDSELAASVQRFQRRNLLQADGVVGEQTRRALNATPAARADQLRVNLERARWLRPADDRGARLWVDIAGYRLHYVRPSGEEWNARVVVGSPRRETPIIHSSVSHLTINPSWTVPPTILREDMLPRIRQDADYLAQHDIEVVNMTGERVAADEVDWQRPGGVMLRQVAGASNPLGRVVVRFPNNDMIYLHDTPARGLFQRDQRALSSGCVRVEGIAELAQMLLEDSGSRYRMRSLLNGGSDQRVNLPNRIPVALHYLTAWPNAQGEVEFRQDIYQRDARVLAAL